MTDNLQTVLYVIQNEVANLKRSEDAAIKELMKSLAGANPDAKPDYRTQSLTELNKLESKVILLNEILDNVDTTRGEKFVQGDVYDVSVLLPPLPLSPA